MTVRIELWHLVLLLLSGCQFCVAYQSHIKKTNQGEKAR